MTYDQGWTDRGKLAAEQTEALKRIARALEHAGVKLPLAYDPKNLAALVEERVLLSNAERERLRKAAYKSGRSDEFYKYYENRRKLCELAAAILADTEDK